MQPVGDSDGDITSIRPGHRTVQARSGSVINLKTVAPNEGSKDFGRVREREGYFVKLCVCARRRNSFAIMRRSFFFGFGEDKL